MKRIPSIAVMIAAAALGGCVVAPPPPAVSPGFGAQPGTGVLYVEQGEDGSPSYIARDIATMSADAPIVGAPQYGVVPAWSNYGGYGYAPYAYGPGPSVYFGWSSAPVWRPYPYAYPGRPIAPRPPPPAVVPIAPRPLGPIPGAWPRAGGPPPGYRGPYRAPYRGAYRGQPAR